MQGIIRSNSGVIENDFGFIKTVFKFSRSHYVWVVCDTIQSGFCVDAQPVSEPTKSLARFFNDELSSSQLVHLSKNLRNTSDISNTLSIIRDQIIEQTYLESNLVYNDFVPFQKPGHYIHGPKSVIHLLTNFNKELIKSILTKELHELFHDDTICKNELGMAYCSKDVDTLSLLEDGIFKTTGIIKPRMLRKTYSKEWPAFIFLQTLQDHVIDIIPTAMSEEGFEEKGSKDSQHLYLAMSRARIKCIVIMFPMDGFIVDDYFRMNDLLEKLKDSIEIRRYPLTPPSYTPRSFTGIPSYFDYFREKFPLHLSIILDYRRKVADIRQQRNS